MTGQAIFRSKLLIARKIARCWNDLHETYSKMFCYNRSAVAEMADANSGSRAKTDQSGGTGNLRGPTRCASFC
jgi:hypothetical protein